MGKAKTQTQKNKNQRRNKTRRGGGCTGSKTCAVATAPGTGTVPMTQNPMIKNSMTLFNELYENMNTRHVSDQEFKERMAIITALQQKEIEESEKIIQNTLSNSAEKQKRISNIISRPLGSSRKTKTAEQLKKEEEEIEAELAKLGQTETPPSNTRGAGTGLGGGRKNKKSKKTKKSKKAKKTKTMRFSRA